MEILDKSSRLRFVRPKRVFPAA